MMESVTQCNSLTGDSVAPSPIPFNGDDSYSQLGIKRNLAPEFSTPVSISSAGAGSERVVQTLRSELERCLAIYRNKRTQANKVQEELKSTKIALDDYKIKAEKISNDNMKLKEKIGKLEEMCGDLNGSSEAQTVREAQLLKQKKQLNEQIDLLKHNNNEIESRLDEVCASEEKLKELNHSLQTRMSELVKGYDEDKRQALEHTRLVCEQHYETAKEKWVNEYKEILQHEKEQTIQEYEEKLSTGQEALDAVKAELSTVKELYVEIGESQQKQEKELLETWQKKFDSTIAQMNSEFELVKVRELESQRQQLVSEHQSMIDATKEEMKQTQDKEMERRIESDLALAKATWFQEHQASKDSAIQSAIDSLNRKWQQKVQQKIDEQLKKHMSASVDSDNNNIANSSDIEINLDQLNDVREQWKANELKEILTKAEQEWREKDLPGHIAKERQHWLDVELESHIKAAKERWVETELKPLVDKLSLQSASTETTDSEASMDGTLIKTRISEALEKAEQKWSFQHKQQLDLVVQQAKEEAIKDASLTLQKELTSLKEMKNKLEAKLAKQAKVMQQQKEALNQVKDEDIEKAVNAVKLQCDEDYKAFMIEHEQSMDAALDQLKSNHQQEKNELIKEHREEIEALQNRFDTNMKLEDQIRLMKDTLEKHWEKELSSAKTRHLEEKQQLVKTHEKKLEESLKGAEEHWLQEIENRLASCPKCERLCAQLDACQQQYTTAAECISTQRQQLTQWKQMQEQQQVSHKKVIDQLKDQITNLGTQLSHKQSALNDTDSLIQSNADKEKQVEELNLEIETLRSELKDLQTEKESLSKNIQLDASTKQSLLDQLKVYEQELQRMRQQHHQAVEQLQQRELDIAELKKELHFAESVTRDREHDGSNLLQQLHNTREEMHAKLKKADKKLKALDAVYRKKIEQIKEGMQTEHNLEMEKMKIKMVELRQSHLINMEKMRRDHANELNEINYQDNIKSTSSQSQTDEEMTRYEGLTEMKAFYDRALDKMRGDLMTRVNDSNQRTADTVQAEVLKERRSTSKRLQKYYMRCLAQILHQKNQWLTYHEKMAYVERALQSIPDRDSSSPSTTEESYSSGTTTPTTLTNNLYTSQNRVEPNNMAAFSPYYGASFFKQKQQRRSSKNVTPVEIHTERRIISTAPSTPTGSGTYAKTRHTFTIAPEDPRLVKFGNADVTLSPTKSYQTEEKTTNNDIPHLPKHRNRHRGHSAEVSVESLLGQTQSLSLFKPSSLENITSAVNTSVINTPISTQQDTEQKYYNLNLDVDLMVQPHLRAVTNCSGSPDSHNVQVQPQVNMPGQQVYQQNSNLDPVYNIEQSRHDTKQRNRRHKHTRSVSPILYPANNIYTTNVIPQEPTGISSTVDSKPYNRTKHRRSRSSDRAYSVQETGYQPLKLTLYSPQYTNAPTNIQSSAGHRFHEIYPLPNTSGEQTSHTSTQSPRLMVQSPGIYPRVLKVQSDSSDTESLISFGSGSSVNDFRQALRINHAGSTPPPLSQKLNLYTSIASTYNSKTDKLHKPVAMVTRQTQAPTPGISTSSNITVKNTKEKRK